MPATSSDSGNTVAGYFTKAEDAQQAIQQLLDEGFRSDQIGAAFHSGPPRSSSTTSGSAPVVNDVPVRTGTDYEKREMHRSGATSGTEAVFPWGFYTGGGSPFLGASRPGPITGSEIPSSIPRELPSEFASEHPYSGSTFESSFCGMGISRDHARRLARELGQGGAIVTVNAGSMNSTAEAVMERNHGVVHYEFASVAAEASTSGVDPNARVQVFGEIHRKFPAYVPGREQERKAS